jgi:predicted HD phosphohydrolase
MTQTTHAPSHVGTSFRRMDESTAEEWAVIGAETFSRQERVGDRVLGMLESLAEISDGFAVDQLTHCLQTATRAERAGADDEVVIASLCHDIGKAVSVPNHPRIAAEILRPYVRDDVYWMVLVHQDFQGRHYYHHFGGDPDARDQYEGHAAYELAERFADEWDQTAFDPDYDTLPLEHFEPRLRELFRHPTSLYPAGSERPSRAADSTTLARISVRSWSSTSPPRTSTCPATTVVSTTVPGAA